MLHAITYQITVACEVTDVGKLDTAEAVCGQREQLRTAVLTTELSAFERTWATDTLIINIRALWDATPCNLVATY
jgi:hypothetical protein